MQTAQRILATLRRPFILAGEEISIGASLGVALMSSPISEASDLLKQADRAMYRVKRGGKGDIAFFDDEDEPARGKMASA